MVEPLNIGNMLRKFTTSVIFHLSQYYWGEPHTNERASQSHLLLHSMHLDLCFMYYVTVQSLPLLDQSLADASCRGP